MPIIEELRQLGYGVALDGDSGWLWLTCEPADEPAPKPMKIKPYYNGYYVKRCII